ncbi:MAG TPA: DUF1330 domain-containing protein [Clostridia bacterium]|nr:DUF1330 domain-containing protein [Clostridia bacterium]
MSAYFIANIRITDQVEYDRYLAEVDEVFARFNGQYITVDENPLVLEGQWDYSRLVLIRFPDLESLGQWYDSEDYRRIRAHRLQGAACDTVVVQGL